MPTLAASGAPAGRLRRRNWVALAADGERMLFAACGVDHSLWKLQLASGPAGLARQLRAGGGARAGEPPSASASASPSTSLGCWERIGAARSVASLACAGPLLYALDADGSIWQMRVRT